MSNLLGFMRPAVEAPRLPAEKVDKEYRRLRRQVFLGIFVGYAAFYLVRKNLALAMPDVLAEFPQYSKAMLGTALTGLSMAYGFSKFVMGSVSDRSNPRWFLPLGLLLSCAVTALCGWHRIYNWLWLVVALQILNGWVNGMGWPPCGKTMVHWFSAKERGAVVAGWNIAHNVGNGLAANFALLGVWLAGGDWGATFWFNGLIGAAVAVGVWFLLRDTPQSCGLPPVEVYKNDFPEKYSASAERVLSFREIFFECVLNNRMLWLIAVANAFVYFVRYGVVDWAPTYLQMAKGFSFKESSTGWALFEYAAIPGTLLCGWISDKVFRGKRAPATILFMGLTLLALVVYWVNGRGPLWIDYAALVALGFFIYGPVMLIGLHALELVPKKAAGTAAGFTGFFGYVFGAAGAGTGVGWLSDLLGWNGVFAVMAVCCVLTMAFSGLTMRKKREVIL